MRSIFAIALAISWGVWPVASFAEDTATQIVGTWKLISSIAKFDGGDSVEPLGPNPKGRLVLTSDKHMIAIFTGANRKSGKSADEKAALLDSMLAYSGTYSIETDKIVTRVDISWNEVYAGPNQNQTRFFDLQGDKLILRTPEIASAVRPGQKVVATLTFEREH